ncbi:RAD51-associated protein 1 isoform X1 [Hemicordylus capensis]|uniref:RAD51-associated protein 1 isoform X1 n=1 Tax=Hemicordylus capensis TaxID=884348 RepID=UPI002303D4AE|nr:RAD51-associated protein 1 isoform X1 [Hemicordylus capensis]
MARAARRNKKVVDYSQFGDADDDDEDFASIAVPSSKKSKRVHPDSKEKKRAPKEEILLQKRSPIKRVTLDDKVYQRHLEVALALSVDEPSLDNCKIEDLKEQDDETCKYVAMESRDSGVLSSCGEVSGMEADQPRAQSQSSTHDEQSQDVSAEELEVDSSFSEEEEDDDDTFVVKKKIKENRKDGRKLNVEARKRAQKPPKLKMNDVVQVKSQPALQKASSFPEPIGKPLKTSSPSAVKKPHWTPPAATGSSANQLGKVPVTSPTQGLRLGLSKLARVKPLHPNFASS